MGEPLRSATDEGLRIAWDDWEPTAFARAAREGKLVFLDISAAWCHWCHVLDRTSLSDPRVVRLLDESFVAIRVDTDRRPDVNDRYNQGGWPTTAVLLPDGRLLAGATYLPPDSLYDLLRQCADLYACRRDQVERYVRESSASTAEPTVPEIPGPPAGPRPEDPARVRLAVMSQYDAAHPGFFREPKFLHVDALAFLSDSWLLGGDRQSGTMLQQILRTMGLSGVFDPVEGGFFRYATRRDWTVPHYEKLLPDNAGMLALYASAHGRTGDLRFSSVAREIARFLFLTLFDPETGAFCASQDADEEYYPLTAAERARRAKPAVDRTIFSAYNALAVSGLVAAHAALGEVRPPAGGAPTFLAAAEQVGAFLFERMWNGREGQLRFADRGRPRSGHLADNVAAAIAHLDLFGATGDRLHLDRAGKALDWTVRHLYSPRAYGFVDRRPGGPDSGPQDTVLVPFAENARMATALVRYARRAARTDLLAVGERLLEGLAAGFARRGLFAAPYGSALLLYAQDPSRALFPGK